MLSTVLLVWSCIRYEQQVEQPIFALPWWRLPTDGWEHMRQIHAEDEEAIAEKLI